MTRCAHCNDVITWPAYQGRDDEREFCDVLCFREARKLRNEVEADFKDTSREKRLAMGR